MNARAFPQLGCNTDVGMRGNRGIHESCRGDSDAANQILKSWIAAQRIESGIHPDPWYSSGSLQERLLQRFKRLFVVA